MARLPLMVEMADRWAVIAGGGRAGGIKAAKLLEAGARVRVVSPALTDASLRAGVAHDRVEWVSRSFEPADLDGVFLAVAATSERAVNRSVLAAARARGVLCLNARDPEAGDIMFASVLRRPPFVVAVATGGRAPAAARALARYLDQQIGPEWQIYGELMARTRDEVKDKVPAPARGSILRTLADLPLLDVIRQGGEPEARAEAAAVISRAVDDR